MKLYDTQRVVVVYLPLTFLGANSDLGSFGKIKTKPN